MTTEVEFMPGFKINLKALMIKRASETGEVSTQTDIQRVTGITQAALSRWYNGATVERLDYASVRKLMTFFNCSLAELVSVEDD